MFVAMLFHQQVYRHCFLQSMAKMLLSNGFFLLQYQEWPLETCFTAILGVYYPVLMIHPSLVITGSERRARVEQQVGRVSRSNVSPRWQLDASSRCHCQLPAASPLCLLDCCLSAWRPLRPHCSPPLAFWGFANMTSHEGNDRLLRGTAHSPHCLQSRPWGAHRTGGHEPSNNVITHGPQRTARKI